MRTSLLAYQGSNLVCNTILSRVIVGRRALALLPPHAVAVRLLSRYNIMPAAATQSAHPWATRKQETTRHSKVRAICRSCYKGSLLRESVLSLYISVSSSSLTRRGFHLILNSYTSLMYGKEHIVVHL